MNKNDYQLQPKISYTMTSEETVAYNFYVERIHKAKNDRDQKREEFDDCTYEEDYIANKRAVNTYLRPKINDAEVRVNTPTTEKKVEILWNELITMNLQPEVLTFDDEDNKLSDLGNHFNDIVRRTNEIEQDEDKYVDGIQELLAQRAVFIEESWIDHTNVSNIGNKRKIYSVQRCDKRFLSGLQMYLGDINIPASRFNDQPYIVKYSRMKISEAEKIYGTWDKFKYVQPGMFNGAVSFGSCFYRLGSLRENEVEIVEYMDYAKDEYQIILNGVMMLAPGYSYKEIVGELGGYHIRMVVPKPMSLDFAYGRSVVAAAKTLQALDNETFRNIIFKFRQGMQPPVGTRSGKIVSKDVWNPASITQGLTEKDFFKLDPSNNGVTNSEMAVFKMMNDMTTEFIGGATTTGTPGKRTTATEILQAQKEAIKLLGLSVLALMRLKREATYLRIYNVLNNYNKPIKRRMKNASVQNIFQKFTIDNTKINDEKVGKKIVQLMDRKLTEGEIEELYVYEENQDKKGDPTRVVAINIKAVTNLRLNWFVSVINKERDSSELAKAMFQDKIAQAGQLTQFTGRMINADRAIESFEKVWGLKDFFQKAPPPQPNVPQPEIAPGGGASSMAEGIKQATGAAHQQPVNLPV